MDYHWFWDNLSNVAGLKEAMGPDVTAMYRFDLIRTSMISFSRVRVVAQCYIPISGCAVNRRYLHVLLDPELTLDQFFRLLPRTPSEIPVDVMAQLKNQRSLAFAELYLENGYNSLIKYVFPENQAERKVVMLRAQDRERDPNIMSTSIRLLAMARRVMDEHPEVVRLWAGMETVLR